MNRDQRHRDSIIGDCFTDSEYGGGIRRFEKLTAMQLHDLYAADFVEDEVWNDCPGNRAFMDFMDRNPGVTAHGYVVDNSREDYRLTIEGVEFFGKVTSQMREAFETRGVFESADEKQIGNNYLYCWYD